MCMMHIDKFHSRMKCVDIYQNEIRNTENINDGIQQSFSEIV